MIDAAGSEARCRIYRRRILDISQKVGALHIAPAFSCLEIVDVIYEYLLEPDSKFIMSKGHGVMAQYVVLEERGVLATRDLNQYCQPSGHLGAHPDRDPVFGIEASTGSLGHGLGMAVGIAYAERLKAAGLAGAAGPATGMERSSGPADPTDPATVYCLISDGELQEGSTWEAMMMAANLGLYNLVVFVDNNDFGGLARMSEQHPAFYSVVDKARTFRWEALRVDGHNAQDIYHVVVRRPADAPTMIVCTTVKGKGVSFMENEPIWHYRSPTPEEYTKAMAEINGKGRNDRQHAGLSQPSS